jgi:hypothetical protein
MNTYAKYLREGLAGLEKRNGLWFDFCSAEPEDS